mmetsp:Transcript_33416/g.91450  ORF Transcript_33416/g.91450 Transcript_33416/m.91450 type:complete len:211 (-) Transcript_33416:1037-1669(-)
MRGRANTVRAHGQRSRTPPCPRDATAGDRRPETMPLCSFAAANCHMTRGVATAQGLRRAPSSARAAPQHSSIVPRRSLELGGVVPTTHQTTSATAPPSTSTAEGRLQAQVERRAAGGGGPGTGPAHGGRAARVGPHPATRRRLRASVFAHEDADSAYKEVQPDSQLHHSDAPTTTSAFVRLRRANALTLSARSRKHCRPTSPGRVVRSGC